MALVLGLCACAGRGEPAPPSVPPITAESEPDRAPDPVPLAVAEPPVAEPPPEPAPPLSIEHEVDRFGHVSLSLVNRSEGPARVALRVLLEREEPTAGAFLPADELGSFEIPGAGEGSCAELLSGAELREIWGCLRGDQRGEGHGVCTPAAAGRYRFVALSCDGRSRTEGVAFAYP